jgi:hypothetical protein
VQCGHCQIDYHPATQTRELGRDANYAWRVAFETYPSCKKFNIRPENGDPHPQAADILLTVRGSRVVYPKGGISRKPAPAEVPIGLAADYNEACLVLNDSAKASAALGRRCLQIILREHAKVKRQDLSNEIDEVLASKQLPTYIANDIDAIRHIGNFAAHPIKSTNSGEIVECRRRRSGVDPRYPRAAVRSLFRRPSGSQEEARRT